jgi:hypothetical protein
MKEHNRSVSSPENVFLLAAGRSFSSCFDFLFRSMCVRTRHLNLGQTTYYVVVRRHAQPFNIGDFVRTMGGLRPRHLLAKSKTPSRWIVSCGTLTSTSCGTTVAARCLSSRSTHSTFRNGDGWNLTCRLISILRVKVRRTRCYDTNTSK